MTEVERLPLIEEIANIFPNEWLAFIISPEEDDDYAPTHGKLVAHSSNPDEIYDAVNTVLWNQHVYVYFNGDFEAMQSSYGQAWDQEPTSTIKRAYSGPKPITSLPSPPPDALADLIYSAVDQLYDPSKINEAIRRLRLARVRAANQAAHDLMAVVDVALDKLESPVPLIDEAVWHLEEALADLEAI